jgi:branched-chain amino acid aminotransferase
MGTRRANGTQQRGASPRAEGSVCVNGEFFSPREAKISVFDHALLYGDGVYDTLMAWNGFVFKLDPHLNRLFRSCRAVKIEPPVNRDRFRELILETVGKSGLRNAYVKCIVTRGTSPAPLLDPRNCTPGLVIFAVPYPGAVDPMKTVDGIRAKISAIRRISHDVVDSRIKSLNYLPFVLARLEAAEAGFDEALMLDAQGYVCEAPGWNVFTVREGKVITPSASILEGITRETVMEICARLSMVCEVRHITGYDLWTADEAFLTSTAGGIVPIVDVDGRRVGMGEPGPIFGMIVREFRSMLKRGEHGIEVQYTRKVPRRGLSGRWQGAGR